MAAGRGFEGRQILMQNRQNGRRRRGGGGNNNPRPMGQPMGGQSANRLEVRVRGNAHQLLEKYKQLARDAHQAGDRVASEYYLQHSDHYFRVLNDSRIRQEEMRARRGVFDQFDDEPMDNGIDGQDDGDDGDRREQPERAERQERAERPERVERSERAERSPRTERPDRGDRPERAERPERPERAERPERTERTERPERQERAERPERAERSEGQERPRRWQERSRDPRDDDEAQVAPTAAPEVAELRMSDGEAALVAFGGAPVRDVSDSAPSMDSEGAEAEAPKPRRRGRPRKTVEPVES